MAALSEGTTYGHKMAIYKKVGDRLNINDKTVRNWTIDFEIRNAMILSNRGKHSKTRSPITDDADFKTDFKAFVKENSRKQGKKKT